MKSNNRVLKVNLSDLSGREMSNREKMSLKGGRLEIGGCCTCGCCYYGEPGGSTSHENTIANLGIPTTTLCESIVACATEGGMAHPDQCKGDNYGPA